MIEKYTNGAWAELAGYKKYSEITFDFNSFPASFQSEGVNMSDYRIYGANDGVGEQTENLFDVTTMIASQNSYLKENGDVGTSQGWYITDYIFVDSDFITISGIYGSTPSICAYDAEKNYIRGVAYNGTGMATINTSDASYVRFSLVPNNNPNAMLTAGSTVPAQYIPFGYQINAEVGDGVTTTDIPIYIGDTPLAQGEYVDYGEQKVYKYVGGVLTPAEPPVALPALPTIDGVTIVDFDNTPKPSRMTGEAIGWKTMTPKIYENGAWT